ncbi:anti-sigma factor family protein [Edaphobacter aggregans]|uniref:anti-sigma factor family protein n=1 Tax=Edaphobacter aggregans TaxID=570835 RepID=UPI000554FC11|nr:zf-HC2 domain-containing protein [Edaphobacter aggregans]
MADINQFGTAQPSRSPDPAHCAQCEAMLADIFDKTLSPEQQAVFDRHLATCPDCSRMFIDAQRGAAWLEMLHDSRPEPSGDLLARILSTTGPVADLPTVSATQANTLLGRPMLVGAPVPIAAYTAKVLPFRQRIASAFRLEGLRHTFMQPRLAMTAAMAFFSIALTLNLTGIRITQLKPSDFSPSSLKRTFYDTNARVVRSIDNLRVVYELESRVRDLQRDSDSSNTPAPESAPAPQNPTPQTPAPQNSPSGDQQPNDQKTPEQQKQKQSSPRPRSGSSHRDDPRHSLLYTASLTQPGSSPETGLEPRKPFAIFTPNTFNHVRQGGQA